MRLLPGFAISVLLLALSSGSAVAHPGKLDGNGCHYEAAQVKPNRHTSAAVKKSRENVCHDKSSPNYSTIRYFVACKTMAECRSSGGKAAR